MRCDIKANNDGINLESSYTPMDGDCCVPMPLQSCTRTCSQWLSSHLERPYTLENGEQQYLRAHALYTRTCSQ